MTLACMTMISPVGDLTLVAGDEGLMAVLWPDDDPARVRLGAYAQAPDHPVLREATSQLSEYFSGQRQRFSVPLEFQGTDFQREVWAALLDIPFGKTRSYADIARAIGRPTATRAVGAANGRNPISIIAPCHRVIGSNGALTGFAGGVETKRFLLALEGAEAPQSTQPLLF